MLGNRDGNFQDYAPTTIDGRVEICPACCKGRNIEWHMVIDCEKMNEFREACLLDDKSLLDVFKQISSSGTSMLSSTEVLRVFLNTDDDSFGTMRQKAEILDFLRCQFMGLWAIIEDQVNQNL